MDQGYPAEHDSSSDFPFLRVPVRDAYSLGPLVRTGVHFLVGPLPSVTTGVSGAWMGFESGLQEPNVSRMCSFHLFVDGWSPRQVQGFHYSSNATDNFAQKCTAVLCAFLAAAVANRWRWTLDEEKVSL